MIAQLFNSAQVYAVVNGPYAALAVFSFLSAFFFEIFVFGVSYYYRKKGKEIKLGLQIVYYFLFVFLGWFVILVIEHLPVRYLFSIWELALIGLGVYIIDWAIYNKIMDVWDRLPWMLVQFAVLWSSFLAIWYYLIFVAQIFGNLTVLSVI